MFLVSLKFYLFVYFNYALIRHRDRSASKIRLKQDINDLGRRRVEIVDTELLEINISSYEVEKLELKSLI